ncbi:TetR/AcrR family transcriptional regulator [Lactobacillus sp. wkB10]|uniref:TetR/AcrR family transcriptional regulator n=1 Tax=Lactobacillus sp. wkB10 TaxID=1545701 RepID=UPI000513CA1F|nr:TetR/AcrR family transcriptional regulator [Lactobacillus sp. wkB10]KGG54706.1 Transcriptional regulator, TetR family [Lactobacillus sp. wkB10]
MVQVISAYEKELNNEKIPAGKKKVLLAALDLFSNQGFHATTTSKIAKAAGVSEATIYKYFQSKDDLLKKLLSPLFIELQQDFIGSLSQYQTLDALVTFIVKDRLEFIKANFDFIKLLLQEILTDPKLLQYFKDLISKETDFINVFNSWKQKFSEIDSSLTPIEIIRIIIGPIGTYALQTDLFNYQGDTNTDYGLIKKQIIAGLTN